MTEMTPSEIATQISEQLASNTTGNITATNVRNVLTDINDSMRNSTVAIDAADIGAGTVSNTEFGYLDGVTSAIQTQLNGKQATITFGAGVATFLATPSSANLRGALTDETGIGAAVFADTPTLVTPVLGVATATSISFGQDTLDYYDIGTWTPVLSDASSAGNASPTASTAARYTRIGNRVFAWCTFDNISTAGMTAGNDLFIQGLPFTAVSASGTNFFLGSVGANLLTFTGSISTAVLDNTSYGRIFETASAAGGDFTMVSEINSGNTELYLMFEYEV